LPGGGKSAIHDIVDVIPVLDRVRDRFAYVPVE